MTVHALASLNGLRANQIIRPGEQLRLTAAAQAGRSRQLPAHMVRVRSGETLWSIAQRHGMTVDALASLNGIYPNQILRPGERLRISAGMRAAGRMLAGVGRGVRRVIYTVRAGDTLWQIAQRFQVRVAQILAWNEMSLRRPILAGEKLMILADSGG
jgi:LysM repeat protein